MFSSRFKWSLEPNRLTQLLETKRRVGAKLLDLTESNPTRVNLAYPEAEILSAFSNPAITQYAPQPHGLPVARQAIVDYYHECGIATTVDQIYVTASTSEAYAYLFKLLGDPGSEILVPQPSYPLLEFLAVLDCVEAIPYRLSYSHPKGWCIDFESLEAAISPRTRAVIVVNPNNPTGSFVNVQDRERLLTICVRQDLALIADEVFADYAWQGAMSDESFASHTSTLTFVVNGLSKIAGLPQMKLGWILANGPPSSLALAGERLELIADTYLSAGTPVQLAAPRLLSHRSTIRDQILDRVLLNRAYVETLVRGTSSRVLAGEGGWYAVLEIPSHYSEEEWVLKILAEDDVLIHPGYFFNFEREAFLVLSLIPEIETFREGCRRVITKIECLA